MSIQRRILFSLLTVSVILCLVESCLRVTVPESQWQTAWEREDGLLLYRSRTYVGGPVDPTQRQLWREGELVTRPQTDSIQHDGTTPWAVRTNAEGLREDKELTPGLKTADRQFLALGDSWMFGVNAPQGNTLPDELERRLPAALGVNSVEVVNGGIPGANAFHMLRRWHYLRDKVAMDGLILGLPHNAPDPDIPAARQAWYQAARGIPAANSRIYQGLRWMLLPYTRPHYPNLLNQDEASDEYAMSMADLKTIISDATDRGIPVWMTLWPNDMNGAQNTQDDFSAWVRPLSAELSGYGGHALTERRCWGSKDTWHPSPAGYSAIASVMAQVIAHQTKNPRLLNSPCMPVRHNPMPSD
jgi:lysophospholipase L1-like esterase